jgi:hypothetical protein
MSFSVSGVAALDAASTKSGTNLAAGEGFLTGGFAAGGSICRRHSGRAAQGNDNYPLLK